MRIRGLVLEPGCLMLFSYLAAMDSLFDLLKRMRPRMHGQCRTGQHHVLVACRGRIGQLGADPGGGIHVDSVIDPVR